MPARPVHAFRRSLPSWFLDDRVSRRSERTQRRPTKVAIVRSISSGLAVSMNARNKELAGTSKNEPKKSGPPVYWHSRRKPARQSRGGGGGAGAAGGAPS